MSKKLEDFIKSNRDAFDDKTPPRQVWNNIQEALPARSAKPWYDNLLMWRAAAVVFMCLSIYLLIPKNGVEPNTVAVNEFNDVEAFYTTQISQKVALIDQIAGDDSGDDFTQDFQQLEAMYLVLKEEWKLRPTKKVKDALVLNLLVRINLLNQQLHRLEESDKGEEKTDAKASA